MVAAVGASTSRSHRHISDAEEASLPRPRLMTATQLADHWQLPVRTIYAWAQRNLIPHYRAGRLLRFDPVEVADHFRQTGFAVELVGNPDCPGEAAFSLLSA